MEQGVCDNAGQDHDESGCRPSSAALQKDGVQERVVCFWLAGLKISMFEALCGQGCVETRLRGTILKMLTCLHIHSMVRLDLQNMLRPILASKLVSESLLVVS